MPRRKEVYDGKTWTAQHERVSQVLGENSWLKSELGEEWCENELLFSERRNMDEVHPLFFHFSAVLGAQSAIQDLAFFQHEMPEQFSSLVRKLKSDRERENVASLLYQLHAFCWFRQRGVECGWEPRTVGGRSTDLDVTLTDGRHLFLEVRTIFPMQADRIHDEQSNWLRAQVNAIPDLAYMVSPWFQGMLTEESAQYLLEEITKEISSGSLPQIAGERAEREYLYNGLSAKIEYELSDDGEGYFSGPGQSNSRYEDAAHIKGKILDKLAKFQLPPRPALSGYLLCLDAIWADFTEVVDAIRGNPKIAVTRDGQFHEIRDPNGVIHHDDGENLEKVDCVIVIEQPSNDWSRETVKFLLNEQGMLEKENLESILYEGS